MNEANTALNAISIPSEYAYELKQLVLPHDSTTAQVALEIIGGGLVTSVSSVRAYRIMNSGNNVITYAAYTLGPSYSSITTNITNGSISTLDRLSVKPANGTTLYIRYNIWKKV